VNYFFIALMTTSGSAIVIYLVFNKILRVKIQILPLLLCAACSLFISMALPKVIVRYTDWIGTLAVLCFMSLICSYFLAYYEDKLSVSVNSKNNKSKQADASETQQTLLVPGATSDDEVAAVLELNGAAGLEELTAEPDSCAYDGKLNAETVSPIETVGPEYNENEYVISDSAEELLDRAFKLKESHEYLSAAKLFQKVLHLNRDSNAAPLLVLESASALKNTGAFQEAVDILSESLTFSSVTGNYFMENQIRIMITDLERCIESEGIGGSESEKEQ